MLKNILCALALLAMPAVSGCAYFAKAASVPSVATYDEKALLSAELAYGTLADAVTDFAKGGLLTKADAEKIGPVMEKLYASLLKARALYAAGNAADAALVTQDVLTQVSAITVLLQDLGVIKRVGVQP